MIQNEYFYFGSIVRKFSFRGEVILRISKEYFSVSKKIKSVYLKEQKKFIPLSFINRHPYKQYSLRVLFENIDSEEKANNILKKDVYLPIHVLPPLEGKEFYSHEVLNFKVLDVKKGFIGHITHLNQTTPQKLFEITNQDGVTILIPAIDEFIETIDRENKTISLKTPEGLIDLYLNI